jgi:hypothetical protein
LKTVVNSGLRQFHIASFPNPSRRGALRIAIQQSDTMTGFLKCDSKKHSHRSLPSAAFSVANGDLQGKR